MRSGVLHLEGQMIQKSSVKQIFLTLFVPAAYPKMSQHIVY